MFKGSTYRLARLLLLLTAAIVGTTLSVVYRQWMLLLVAVPALIFLFSALFRLHFQNIRKMTFMFNSIENGDYSFKFTEYDAPVSDNLLNLTLNRIKDLLVKAKNEVIDKERYYELILNSVHTGVIVLNETGNVYQINNEARRLIGLPRFTHINQLATIDRSLRELFFAIRGGERKQASYSNERGTVYLAVNAFIAAWGDYLTPSMYNNSTDAPFTLAYALYDMTSKETNSVHPEWIFAAATIMSVVPTVLFAVFQKFLIEGVQTAGLKG